MINKKPRIGTYLKYNNPLFNKTYRTFRITSWYDTDMHIANIVWCDTEQKDLMPIVVAYTPNGLNTYLSELEN